MTDKTTDETTEVEEPHIRPFADFLRELRAGAVHDEASTALHDLIAAVQETRKAGTLTLTFKVSMEPRTDMLKIADSVGKKIPALERPQSLWFVDSDGNVTRDHPGQMQFESIRVVTPDTKPGKAKQA